MKDFWHVKMHVYCLLLVSKRLCAKQLNYRFFLLSFPDLKRNFSCEDIGRYFPSVRILIIDDLENKSFL